LDAVAKSEQTVSESENLNIFELLESWGLGVVQNWQTGGDRLPMFAAAVSKGFSTFVERRGGYETLMMLLKMGFGILLGLAAYFFVMGSPLRRWGSLPDADDTLGLSLIKLFKKLALDLVAIMAFLLVSIASHRYFLTLADRPLVEGFMTTVIVIPMCVAALGRFLMSPYRPEARLVHIDDASALYFQRQQIAVAAFAGFTYFIIQFLEFQGIAMSDLRVSYALNLILFIWIGIVVYRGRDALTMMMLGGHGEETRAEKWVAERYSTILLVMLLFVWLVVEILGSQGRFDIINSNPHYYTIILLGLAPAFDMMVRALVRHMVGPMTGEGLIAERAYKSTKRSYIRIGRIIVFSAILLYLADKWSIDLSNLASAGLGAKVASNAVEFLVVAAIGYMVWELVTLWFNRKLAAEMTASGFDLTVDEPGGGEGGGVGGSRLSTVLPLLRMTLQTAIIVMTLLIGLGNIGIDITPLLAGAGIVGIAIGFGAQALVRDVVSGIFFLIDDAFRVGEYLVIEDTVGTVEKISLRSMQLRHHKGPVHTIPYGEIPKVTNNSRDWVIMKLKFTFPFETDANKIKKIFKKIGAEMLEAEYAGDLLQTFKSQGVYDVDDVGIIIRGKFMAKPGTQWVIRKDVYNRIQRALDEAGIQFARKEVRVQVPGLEQRTDLTDSQKNAIAAAASEVAEESGLKAKK
ncbi:MAG: mechanosensitive ion channel domain-containing protein, partial [Salaquimonas sp.]